MACRCNDCDECEERGEIHARRLLYRHLTSWQKRSVQKNGYFVVKGNVTGNKYHVYYNGDDAVFSADAVNHYCLDVFDENKHYVPEGDRVLARKLLIQADEETFLRVACRTPQN